MQLESLFSPRSIAVIGASEREGSVGASVMKNLLEGGFSGKIFPINPKSEKISGLPCFPKVSEVNEEIDLAIIIVPAAFVPGVLREVGEKNIPGVIIISSGFKETGEAGAKLEEEVASIAKEFRIALLGPNCLGFLHPKLRLNASFAKTMPKQGEIAFFSQSGALCTAVLDLSEGKLGFSHFVSTGNKAVLGENELLHYFAKDEETKVIGFYSEGLTESRKIIETGRAILSRSEPKPIVALKSGVTDAGTKASSSHTGALAGSDAAYEALFRQARIIRAEGLEHLFELFSAFGKNTLPKGKRIAIITNAGGLGVLATDKAIQNGLELASLSDDTKEKLKKSLPAAASVNNPVDVLGDALTDRYEAALSLIGNDPTVDMLCVIVTPQTMTEGKKTAEAIANFKKRSEKPLVSVFAGRSSLKEGVKVLEENGVATFLYPESGVRALSALSKAAEWQRKNESTPFTLENIDREKAASLLKSAPRIEGRISEDKAREVFEAYGFVFPKSTLVASREEAEKVSGEFSGKVVLKIVSSDIVHKSDAGGVLLNIDPQNIGEAFEKLLLNVKEKAPQAKIEGALIAEMAKPGGKEMILGMKEEPGLGKLLMVGLGGIYVETFKDVAFGFAPLTVEDAKEMVESLKTYPLLKGARGGEAIDEETLLLNLGRLSQLVNDFPEITELDINPLLVFPKSEAFRVLDARIRMQE